MYDGEICQPRRFDFLCSKLADAQQNYSIKVLSFAVCFGFFYLNITVLFAHLNTHPAPANTFANFNGKDLVVKDIVCRKPAYGTI